MKFVVLNYFYLDRILFYCFIVFCSHVQGQSDHLFDKNQSKYSKLIDAISNESWEVVTNECDHMLESNPDQKTKGIAFFYKAETLFIDDNINSALLYYEDALQYFISVNYIKGLAFVYAQLGDIEFKRRNNHIAQIFLDQAIYFASFNGLEEILINSYQKKATIYTNLQQGDSAITCLKMALLHNPKSEQKNTILNQVSTNYQAIGKLDSAIIYFEKSIRLKKSIDDFQGLISDYCALGNMYRERGAYLEAQKQLVLALELAEVQLDTFALITIYREMGDIYMEQGVWNTAEKHYLKVLFLANLKNNNFSKSICYQKLGELFQYQNKDILAIDNYETALKLFKQFNSKVRMSEVLISLSKLYKDSDQNDNAKNYLVEALQIRHNSNDSQSSYDIKMALAEIELLEGSFNQSEAYIKDCLIFCVNTKNKQGIAQCYKMLANVSSKQGNYKEAFFYQKQFEVQYDSIRSIELTKTINEVELLYETEKRDKEITEQKASLNLQKVKIQRRNNQLILLFGGLILTAILSIFLFYFIRKNKEINKQKIKVLEKEKETQRLRSIIIGEEKERKRMARELHDGLGAVLATVKMGINGIQYKYPEVGDLPVYNKAESLIDQACRTVREISHNLMPIVLEQQGLEFAIDDLCQSFQVGTSTTFHFYFYGDESKLSEILKITTFRITQELLKNAIKHANTSEVIVQLTIESSELSLIIEDDGDGFDIETVNNGLGLENIKSRTTYLNGNISIESIVGEGSTFTIVLPIVEFKT